MALDYFSLLVLVVATAGLRWQVWPRRPSARPSSDGVGPVHRQRVTTFEQKMKLSHSFERIAKGLVLHYLQGGTVEQAVLLGEKGGVPGELLQSLPGMMFQATSAAGAVGLGEKTLAEVVEMLVVKGAPREDAEILVVLALEFMRELAATFGKDASVPRTSTPWYEYQ